MLSRYISGTTKKKKGNNQVKGCFRTKSTSGYTVKKLDRRTLYGTFIPEFDDKT